MMCWRKAVFSLYGGSMAKLTAKDISIIRESLEYSMLHIRNYQYRGFSLAEAARMRREKIEELREVKNKLSAYNKRGKNNASKS
jgi:hypothetical protein